MAMKLFNSPLSAAAALLAALSLICTVNHSLLFANAAELGTAGFFGSRSSTSTACRGLKAQGKFTAAADIRVFQNGKACGQSFEVTCTGANCRRRNKVVVVKIVDTCSPTKNRPCQTLTLSRDAFAAIADPNAGVVSVTFKPVKGRRN